MKQWKKLLTLAMALMMVLSLVACGGDGGEKSKPVEEVYGLDLASTEEQPMSSERAESAALYSAVKGHFGDMTMFSSTEFEKMTYDDLKELLGVDASYYFYDENSSAKAFVWLTSDNETAKLAFWFRDTELYALGSTNLG